MELWITFSSGGKELVAYTVEGTFAGEVAATLKSIEAERGIPQDKILVRAVMQYIIVSGVCRDAAPCRRCGPAGSPWNISGSRQCGQRK